MKVSELRIGNIYNSVKFNTPVKCTAEDICEMVKNADGAMVDEEVVGRVFSPIRLTEPWVLNIGFERNKNGLWSPHNCWHEYAFRTKGSDLGTLGLQPDRRKYPVVYALLYYVHQAQNLHFSLTDSELITTI